MNTIANTMGVYRAMQGHMNGFDCQQAVQSNHETTQAIIRPLDSGKTKGMAFALQRDQALTGQISPAKVTPHEPVQKVQDPIYAGDVTQLNAGSIDMSRYIQSVMSGNIEGPVPMTAIIARQNYERAMGFLS